MKLAEALGAVKGVTVLNDTFFNEFTIRVDGNAELLIESLAKREILGGLPVSRLEPDRPELADLIVVAATELTTDDDIARFAAALTELVPC